MVQLSLSRVLTLLYSHIASPCPETIVLYQSHYNNNKGVLVVRSKTFTGPLPAFKLFSFGNAANFFSSIALEPHFVCNSLSI